MKVHQISPSSTIVTTCTKNMTLFLWVVENFVFLVTEKQLQVSMSRTGRGAMEGKRKKSTIQKNMFGQGKVPDKTRNELIAYEQR